jgi:hypothetical protein
MNFFAKGTVIHKEKVEFIAEGIPPGNYELEVYSANGSLVSKVPIKLDKSPQIFFINARKLMNAGVYFVKISGLKLKPVKLVKIK